MSNLLSGVATSPEDNPNAISYYVEFVTSGGTSTDPVFTSATDVNAEAQVLNGTGSADVTATIGGTALGPVPVDGSFSLVDAGGAYQSTIYCTISNP